MVADAVAQLEPVTAPTECVPAILIVEDDESQVVALEHHLQKQGYRVLAAYNAAQAWQLALDARPQLILLDLHLPDRNGLELCSHLADHPRTCDVPIIILSAVEGPDIVRQSRAVGGSHYLRKPYDPNVLLMLIETSLRQPFPPNW